MVFDSSHITIFCDFSSKTIKNSSIILNMVTDIRHNFCYCFVHMTGMLYINLTNLPAALASGKGSGRFVRFWNNEIRILLLRSSRKFPYLLKSVRIKLVNGWVQTINLFGVTDQGVTLRGSATTFRRRRHRKFGFWLILGPKKYFLVILRL